MRMTKIPIIKGVCEVTKPIYTTLGNNIEDIANNLLRENEELKAKLQVSDLQRVKDVCNKHINNICINCRFEAKAMYPSHERTFCILDDSPNNWDIDFILEKLDV